MSENVEQAAEIVADAIVSATESANEEAARAEIVADEIAKAAMETERGKRIEQVEKDLGECLANQAAMAEAMQSLMDQQSQMMGSLSTLQSLIPLTVSKTEASDAGDGLRENQEPVIVVTEPEAEPPSPPMPDPPEPKRKKFRLI
jgi:hypothetical protein